MIQQYFKLDVPQDDLLHELLDYTSMPTWWPGLDRATLVSTPTPQSYIIDAVFKLITTVTLRVEFVHRDNVITFRQLKGWFKSYEGEWFLQPASGGVGTTLRVTLQPECGALVPKSMVHAKLSENLSQFGTSLQQRLQAKKALTTTTPARQPMAAASAKARDNSVQAAAGMRKLLHIFQTPEGLEIWLDGRRYLLKPAS